MIIQRIFKDTDATAVAALVKKTMLTTNIKDYTKEYLENDLKKLTALAFIERAKYFHCYVFSDSTAENKIVGVGSIGAYWGKKMKVVSSIFSCYQNIKARELADKLFKR